MTATFSVISCNIPCRFDLDICLGNLPPADLYCLQEIQRSPEVLTNALKARGLRILSYSLCPAKHTVSTAIATSKAILTKSPASHPHGASSIDIKLPLGAVRVITVYAAHNMNINVAANLAGWICNRAPATFPTVIIGDFNVNTQRGFSQEVAQTLFPRHYEELVKGKPTFTRGQTSIDRCYTNITRAQLSIANIPEASDHMVLTLLIRCTAEQTTEKRPWHMKHPSRQYRPAASSTLQDWLDAIRLDAIADQKTPHRKLYSLQHRLHCAHQERARANRDNDPEAKSKANHTIRKLRHLLITHTHARVMTSCLRPQRDRFSPPTAVAREHIMEHMRNTFTNAEPTHARSNTQEDRVDITVQHVTDAIKQIKATSSTSDYSAKYLRGLSQECLTDMAMHFTEWVNHGIPPRITEATLLLLLKPGRPASDAKSYRPISVVTLLGKLLHYSVYVAIKNMLIPKILALDFQHAFTTGNPTPRLFMTAQQHLDADPQNVVIITDLKAAFDSVDHTTLVAYTTDTLGPQWATIIGNILSAQCFRVALPQGLSDSMPMTTGVMQGSPLSGLLFALLTMTPPRHSIGPVHAYADDCIVCTNVTKITESYRTLHQWATDRKLSWNPAKVSILSQTACSATIDGNTYEATREARYMGCHLHAGPSHEPCLTDQKFTQAVENKCEQIACMRSLPTIYKARLFKTYALPILAHHSLSKCCVPTTHRLENARNCAQ